MRWQSSKGSCSNWNSPCSSEFARTSCPVVWFRSLTCAPATIPRVVSSTVPLIAPVSCPITVPARRKQENTIIANDIADDLNLTGLLRPCHGHQQQAGRKSRKRHGDFKDVISTPRVPLPRNIGGTSAQISAILPQLEWWAGIL